MAAGPSLVKLLYRTGAFHRTDELSTAHQLPFVPAYIFSTCTLEQLVCFLAASRDPDVLPSPAVGTRVAFRLVHFNDISSRENGGEAAGSSGLAGIVVKYIGSVVVGGGGPGAPTSLASLESLDDFDIGDLDVDRGAQGSPQDGGQVLADARFAAGDYISCAIMPPMANGCVVPADDIRTGRGVGMGAASTASERPPPPPRNRDAGAGGRFGRDSDFRVGKRGRNSGGVGPPSSAAIPVPPGEWRRGDTLPETDVWVRDGGRPGVPSSSGGGGAAGRPGTRRRRWNGR